MSGRVRLLLIVAVLVVLIGVGAAVVLPGLQNPPTPTQAAGTPGTGVAQGSTATPRPGVTQVAATAVPTLDIVVAIQSISRGTLINPDMVAFRTWPEEYAPVNALFSLEDVTGKIARVDIVREQPILAGMLTETLAGLGQVGSDAAAILPAGTRMVSIPIDALTTGAYAIQPGDRVDAIISLLFVDLDEEFQSILPNNIRLYAVTEEGFSILAPIDGVFGSPVPNFPTIGTIRSPSEPARPRLTTQMTIQDALVIYNGLFPSDGKLFRTGAATPNPSVEIEPTAAPSTNTRNATAVPTAAPARPNIISLAMSPQEAVVLTYYVEARIPVTFALRPANDTGTVTTQPVTLDYIIRTYNIAVPAKLAYGIEPAIRSIRQLITTEVLVFGSASGNVQSSEGQ